MGIWLGIDLGNARVGLAKSDPEQTFAYPLRNIAVDSDYFEAMDEVIDIAEGRTDDSQIPCDTVVIGLPLNMDGSAGKSAKKAIRFAKRLAASLGASFSIGFSDAKPVSHGGSRMCKVFTVMMVDERLTTVSAYGQLRESGIHAGGSRTMIDQQSAVVILQSALDWDDNVRDKREQGRQ